MAGKASVQVGKISRIGLGLASRAARACVDVKPPWETKSAAAPLWRIEALVHKGGGPKSVGAGGEGRTKNASNGKRRTQKNARPALEFMWQHLQAALVH